MKRFIKEYDGKRIEDCGSYTSKEFDSFSRKFKNALKRSISNEGLKMKITSKMVYIQSPEADELYLFAINNGDLYRSQTQYTIRSMGKKRAKGTYKKELAVVAYYKIATAAAKEYEKEFGSEGWHFTTTQRWTAATDMADYYEEQEQEAAENV